MNTLPQKTSVLPPKPRFHVFDASLDLIRSLRELIEVVQRRDGDLAKQLRKAAASISLNISEGNRRRGKDRIHLWRMAAGSAAEVRSCLYIAGAWGYLESSAIIEPPELLDRILAMLWRLTE